MRGVLKPIAQFGIVIISIVLLYGAGRSIYQLWKRQDYIRERLEAYRSAKKLNDSLKQQLRDANTPEFVEREAREKLGMTKDGDTVVLLPGQAGDGSGPASPGSAPDGKPDTTPNITRWWKLFF